MVVMGNNYTQLNIEDRVMIGMLKSDGKSLRAIGRELGRSHSTILRELKRNAPVIRKGYYLAHKADERADERKSRAGGFVWRSCRRRAPGIQAGRWLTGSVLFLPGRVCRSHTTTVQRTWSMRR